MSNPRNRILASTALALVLAAPLGYLAKGHLTAMAATSAEPAVTQFAPVNATPVNASPATPPRRASRLRSPRYARRSGRCHRAGRRHRAADRDRACRRAGSAGRARPRRPRGRREDPRPPGHEGRQALHRQEGARGGRGVLPEPQPAPLWLDKGVENARAEAVIARMKNADADGLEPGDYKAPSFSGLAPDALAEAELRLTRAALDLCPPRAGRPLPLYPREQEHRAAAGGAGAGGRAEQRRGCRRCEQGARCLQPAERALPQAQGGARRPARQAERQRRARSTPSPPTWSAGAGIRATSAPPTRWSTCRTSRCG